jgi:DNA polymerase-1
VRPDQVVDLLTLTGDSVDNVPGVPGIGPKTASQLLCQFGTLEALLEKTGEVAGAKKQEALRSNAQSARLSRKLIELRRDVPIALDWEALRYSGYDARALKELCTECGFHQFRAELVDGEAPPETGWDTDAYEVVDTPEALAALVVRLKGLPKFSFDTETTSIDPLKARLVGMSFSWEKGQACYVPVRGPLGSRVLDEALALRELGPVLSNPGVEILGQNLKHDMLVLRNSGVKLSPQLTDTMVLSYLLESGERNHDLDALSKRLLDHTMIPLESLIGKGKTQRGMDQVPVPDIAAYAGEDADAAWRLEELLRPQIESGGLWKLYAELERPLIFVLARMEEHGVKVDVKRLKALSDEFAGRLEQIKSEIYAQAGRSFNISSGPQLRQVLFDELKLPVTKKTPKGEASTDADVLEELAAKHTLPRLIVQHRQLEKLKGTYLDALPAMVHGDGRIHSSFSQVVAATGRLSSSDPNLQNIPVRTEDGKQIRQAFVAGFDGWSMLTADYSQIELRVLAHFSRDEALMKAFAEDRDIHAEVAAKVYGVPQAQVTSQQRGTAKMVNFGVIYGLSAFGLAARLGIPQADAARFIDAYFREFAGVERFINATRAYARDHGRVETILGRRRAIQGVKNVTGRNLNLAERTAVNTVIQGSAADLIKKAMLLIDEAIRARGLRARMLLQIHDELVFEVPNEEIDALAELVRAAMTTALPLDVALKVDLGRGPNWLDTLDLD